MIKDNNYIVIQGWMRDLGLSGNKLMVFAIIYGFSQDENSMYSGTASYIADWLGVRKHTVLDILKELTANGLLEKVEKNVNGIKLCDYRIPTQVVRKSTDGGAKIAPGGDAKIAPHNTSIDNTRDNTPPIIPPKGGKGFCEELKFLEPYCKDLEPFLAIKDFQEYEYLFPALREWLDYKVRCKKHKYATIKQIHILCRQLHDFCDGDINSATKTIETSIANNWSGVVFSNKNKTKSATKDEITEFVNLWYKFAECVDKAKKNPMYNFSFASPVVATKYEEVEKLYPRAKNNLLAMLDKFRTQNERQVIDVADLDTSEPWKFAINVLYKRWKQSSFLRGEGMVRRLDAQFFLNNIERLANPCDPIYMNN